MLRPSEFRPVAMVLEATALEGKVATRVRLNESNEHGTKESNERMERIQRNESKGNYARLRLRMRVRPPHTNPGSAPKNGGFDVKGLFDPIPPKLIRW